MTPDRPWIPVDARLLPSLLADRIDRLHGAPRIAIDAAPCAAPGRFTASLASALRALGRPVDEVAAETFWRDASVRLEHGREDVQSYLSWLDTDALRRETLGPFGDGMPYLPSLRDPVTNRSTREAPRDFVPRTVLLVTGTFLFGPGLPFDFGVHLYLPPEARARRTPADEAWTLPAFETYEAAAHPLDVADVTVRLDRRSPAVQGLEHIQRPRDTMSAGRRSVVRR